MMGVNRFNIRVYGVLVHAQWLLLSDEVVQGKRITKFPGGGLVPGEGTLDGLRREIREELGQEARILHHFYTTDFFQQSAYVQGDQIISIYYTFEVPRPGALLNGTPAPGLGADKQQMLRWLPLAQAQISDVDLPIDRVVMKLIMQRKWMGQASPVPPAGLPIR